MFYNEAKARILPPLMPLKSLADEARITPYYSIPAQILTYYLEHQRKYKICVEKLESNQQIFEEL